MVVAQGKGWKENNRGSIHLNMYFVYTFVCYMKKCWNYVMYA